MKDETSEQDQSVVKKIGKFLLEAIGVLILINVFGWILSKVLPLFL